MPAILPSVSRRALLRVGLTTAALASAFAASGCSTTYRSNPTPEMATLSNTDAEVANRTTITFDTNLSAIWEDAARFMLLDRPSLLTRPRMPY